MADEARDAMTGGLVFASEIDAERWAQLKQAGAGHGLRMSCCDAQAILKTSQNDTQFFAHSSGACETAPETQWHRRAKALILAAAKEKSLASRDEATGGAGKSRWRADILLELREHCIAIEVQRSKQHVNKYLARQLRYAQDGVKGYWLVIPDQFPALSKAMARLRRKREFSNTTPPKSLYPFLPELPLFVLELEPIPRVVGDPRSPFSVAEWMQHVIDGSFMWRDGRWHVGEASSGCAHDE